MNRKINGVILGFILIVLLISSTTIASAQEQIAELGVFEEYEVSPDALIQVPVSVRNVQDLYGYDLTLEFDPALVQVEDADTATSGIQVSLGEFLDPGLLLFNTADNEAGTIRVAMAQYNPSEPRSGEGILIVITFRGAAEGVSPLTISEVMLSTRDGEEIQSEGVDSLLTVSLGAPAQEATFPVADPTGLILISTFTPTPIPTKTPVATITPVATEVIEPEITAQSGPTQAVETTDIGSLAGNAWWIVLVLLGLVGGGGYYLFRIKNRSDKQEDGK